MPREHRDAFSLTEEVVKGYLRYLLDETWGTRQKNQALEARLSTLAMARDNAAAERDQLKNQLQVSNTSNAHLQKHNDTLMRQLHSLRDLVPVEFRSALATPEEEVGGYIRKLQVDRGDAIRERDAMARQWREMFKSRQAEIAKTLTQRVEENLFNGGDLREKLAKAEAKVQKLTERLAKCGMARVDLERQLEVCAEQVKAERVEDRRTELALRIVVTHLYNLEKRKYAAASSADIKTIGVHTATRPEQSKVAVDRFAWFSLLGLGLDGLVNLQIKDLA